MTPPVSETAIELRRSNSRLRTALDSLAAESSAPGSITAKYLLELHRDLARTQHLLQQTAATTTSELREEQLEYRRNLEELQSLLTGVQSRMLIERARLDRDRNHLAASAQWRSSVKEFL